MPPSSKHIILVGGEPVTVSAIAQTLSQISYRVSTVPGAQEALRLLQEQQVDLVVCDVRQNGLEDVFRAQAGQAYYQSSSAPFLFIGDPRWPAAKLLAESKKRRFIALPCDGQTLLGIVRQALGEPLKPPKKARPSAAARPQAPAPKAPEMEDYDFAGRLEALPMEELLQLMEQTRKTGLLTLETERFTGSIYCVNGSIHHADLGEEVEGSEAVYLLVNLRAGRFTFKLGVRPEKQTIDTNIASLLLEGLRQRDETLTLVSSYKKKQQDESDHLPSLQ